MIREINVKELTDNISEMCIQANHYLSPDMDACMKQAVETEKSELGKKILNQLQENLEIADKEMIPICQDTGMAVIFMEIGQDVHFVGGDFEEAVNEGVRRGYVDGYLRKSVVKDPLIRENTKDNTPAILHTKIVPGDKVKITIAPKGFGSENMSRIFMLKPADGIEGVKNAILAAVKDAGPNACPPMVVGVGIGGTFEKCALLAKQALTRPVNEHSDIPYVKEMEEEMLTKINHLGASDIIRDENTGYVKEIIGEKVDRQTYEKSEASLWSGEQITTLSISDYDKIYADDNLLEALAQCYLKNRM